MKEVANLFSDRFAALESAYFSEQSRSFSMSLPAGLITNDAHFVNQADTLRCFTAYFLVFGACLNQFIKKIGKANFQDTIIQVAGDFNRIPKYGSGGKDALLGSDHGWEGNVTSLLGGSLKPQVFGNVRTDSSRNDGHWGLAESPYAPLSVATYVGRKLGLDDEALGQLAGGVAFPSIEGG